MLNIPQIGIINTLASVPFETEYQAILDRGTALGYALPSAGQQIKQNTLVAALKAAGAWALLDIFYVYATDGDSDFATINWKSPTTFQCTKINSPSFATNAGFTGNGTSSNLSTTWATSAGVNYTQNDNSFGGHINTSNASTGCDFGSVASTTVTRLRAQESAGNLTVFNNQATATTIGNAATLGFYQCKRTLSNATAVFKNGSSVGTGSTTSAALHANAVAIGAQRGNSSWTIWTDRQYSCFFAGAAMTGLESALYSAWNTYFTSL